MTIIIGIILLGILVFLHELGHFSAAKFFGVKIEAFSIGMGPVLLHKKWHGTDWRISLFPFGGYCAMKGEKDIEFFDCPKDSLYGTKPFFRSLIGFAGPFSNVLFAFTAYFLIACIGYSYYSSGNTIRIASEIYPEIHSAAAEAGLKTGDKITRINETEIKDFSDIYNFVAIHADEDIEISLIRDDTELLFTVHTDLNKETGEGKIGIMSDPDSYEKRETMRYNFFPAIIQGLKETVNTIVMTFKSFTLLFKGIKLEQAVSGPARITSMLGNTAKSGFALNFRSGLCATLQLMALISISLFIMNLLPIPVLDGWLVYSSIFEIFFRIRLSSKTQNTVQFIGIIIIAVLFIFALTNDFKYFLGVLK